MILEALQNLDSITGIIGILLYGLLGLLMIISFFWTSIKLQKIYYTNLAIRVRKIFRTFLSLFVISKLLNFIF